MPRLKSEAKILQIKGKGKAIPLQPWTGPEVSRKLRLPDYRAISPTHRPPLHPANISGTHFY